MAVLGAGGLGHLAIQFLHKMGHHVTAFSHSPAKRALIERLGGAFADSSDADRLSEYQGEFDFILSTLNVAFDIDSFVRMPTPQGQLCLVASPLKQLSLSGRLLNLSRRSIHGNYIGGRADTTQMLAFSSKHGIIAANRPCHAARTSERAIERVSEEMSRWVSCWRARISARAPQKVSNGFQRATCDSDHAFVAGSSR